MDLWIDLQRVTTERDGEIGDCGRKQSSEWMFDSGSLCSMQTSNEYRYRRLIQSSPLGRCNIIFFSFWLHTRECLDSRKAVGSISKCTAVRTNTASQARSEAKEPVTNSRRTAQPLVGVKE